MTQARQDASTIRSSDREHMIRGFVQIPPPPQSNSQPAQDPPASVLLQSRAPPFLIGSVHMRPDPWGETDKILVSRDGNTLAKNTLPAYSPRSALCSSYRRVELKHSQTNKVQKGGLTSMFISAMSEPPVPHNKRTNIGRTRGLWWRVIVREAPTLEYVGFI